LISRRYYIYNEDKITDTRHGHQAPSKAQQDSGSQTKTQKGLQVMYTILKGKTPVIDCDDMQTAIRFVQSLESGINRYTDHSPYTIVKATDVTRPGVKIGAPDFIQRN